MHSFITLAKQLLLKTKFKKPTLTARQNSLMDASLFLISNDLSLSLIGLAVLKKSIYKMTSCLDHSRIHTKKKGWGWNTSLLVSINDSYERLDLLFLVWF